jgi:DNA polymerase III delta prime subunit
MTTLIVGGSNKSRRGEAKKIFGSEFPTLLESGKVEDVRDFIHQISFAPKFALIDTLLTVQSQNALLKTLEEPPENTSIIICSPSENIFLPTILSRCKIIRLPQELEKIDEFEKIDFSWAQSLSKDREKAITEVDKLLVYARGQKNYAFAQKILKARKYLKANTNVRLTLENLSLSM